MKKLRACLREQRKKYDRTADSGGTGQSASARRDPDDRGVNFSIFSRNAQGVEMLLFDKHDDPLPARLPGEVAFEVEMPLIAQLEFIPCGKL